MLNSLGSAFDKILFGTPQNTTVAFNTALNAEVEVSPAFQLMSVSCFRNLAVSVDRLLEFNLGNDNFTISNQNLIEGLQIAASRAAANMIAGDSDIIINGLKFAMVVRKVSKTVLSNSGIFLNVTAVANSNV